jgi:hypothetical protein
MGSPPELAQSSPPTLGWSLVAHSALPSASSALHQVGREPEPFRLPRQYGAYNFDNGWAPLALSPLSDIRRIHERAEQRPQRECRCLDDARLRSNHGRAPNFSLARRGNPRIPSRRTSLAALRHRTWRHALRYHRNRLLHGRRTRCPGEWASGRGCRESHQLCPCRARRNHNPCHGQTHHSGPKEPTLGGHCTGRPRPHRRDGTRPIALSATRHRPRRPAGPSSRRNAFQSRGTLNRIASWVTAST